MRYNIYIFRLRTTRKSGERVNPRSTVLLAYRTKLRGGHAIAVIIFSDIRQWLSRDIFCGGAGYTHIPVSIIVHLVCIYTEWQSFSNVYFLI